MLINLFHVIEYNKMRYTDKTDEAVAKSLQEAMMFKNLLGRVKRGTYDI